MYLLLLYYPGLCQVHSMTFAQRRNRLTTHFSDRIPVVKLWCVLCVTGSIWDCVVVHRGHTK